MSDITTVPKWRFADAVRVAGVTPYRLARWLDRGVVRLRPYDADVDGSGSHRLLSLRRIYQIAIVAELGRLGISATRAARAALAFTDAEQPSRKPAHLFADGPTWLAVLPNRDLVIRPPAAEGLQQLFTSGAVPGFPPSAALLDLAPLVRRVDEALSSKD